MAALQGYAGVSTQMNAQANALSTANRDRQLAAQGMYVDQSGQLRRDTFQESYARGVAADRATEFNTTTKLNATNMQGQLATDMRTQSFNEDFSTKSAADQMATFNKAQSQISQRWQEGYAADQQRDLTNRNHLVEQAGNQYTDTAMTGATNIANGGFGVNSAADARTQGSIGVQSGLGMNAISGYSSASGAQLGAGQFGVNVNQGNLNNIGSAAGLRITDNNTTTDRHVQSYQDKTKANAADVGMQIAAASIPPIKNEDDGSDNDFDRWQNSNRGAHDFD
jgi:hypothetical protein